MKNLQVLRRRRARLQMGEKERLVAATVDSEHDLVFFVSNAAKLYWMPLLSDNQHSMSMEVGAAVVGMEFILELEALAIGLENGDLLLVQAASGNVEVVGTLQGGISALSTSPDGELLAVATGLGKLLLMTTDWDILHEFPISQQKVTCSGVSWRPDAKYFATTEYSTDGQSLVKIWERETGNLFSQCDAFFSSSDSAIAWCPSGGRVAVSKSKVDGSPTVMIFERNGFKKDSFKIRAPAGAKLETLQWDATGTILQVVIRCNDWDAVQLWNCSNYHWYLKQEWRYSSVDVVNALWHPERCLCTVNWTASGNMEVVSLGWRSAVISPHAVALVVDGSDVLVTPLASSIMPPPMHLFKVHFTAPVNTVTITADYSSGVGTVAASLADGNLGLATLSAPWSELENVEVKGSTVNDFHAGVFSHMTFLDRDRLCGISEHRFVEVEVTRTAKECCLQSSRESVLDKPVAAVARSDLEVFIQLDDGSIFCGCPGGLGTRAIGSFPNVCPWMEVVEMKGHMHFIGLDDHGRLHVDNAVVDNDCSSFASHIISTNTVHLLYTTNRDTLRIINLDNSTAYAEVVDVSGGGKGIPFQKDFNVQRVWERGARIIGTLGGGDVAVILQTSRGNLETMYPRGLVLQAVATALEEHKFQEAIVCARRHRIDLNVIVDFIGTKEFASLASEFVNQVGKLNLVTELVSGLRNENVLELTYHKTLSSLTWSGKVDAAPINKVQVVLGALRTAVEKDMPDTPSRELCMLTILARNDPPLLEEALKRIKKIREGELGLGDGRIVGEGKLTAEGAVKHLIWLVDANAVFDAALGLYDLHLAAMVASHSQRDPKEFLPFLQELEDMPSSIMRYKIDFKLQKYESALKNLACAGAAYFVDVLELLRSHPHFFPVALSIFTHERERTAILEAWGDQFLAQEKFEDAAMSFSACSQLRKALGAYRVGGLWQGVLLVAGQLDMPAGEINSLAAEIREELQAMGRPKEAARIALDYCHDLEGAVNLLIEARDWMEVLRLCYLHLRAELVEKLVRPAALECSSALMAQFEEGTEKVRKYCARFVAVRQRRLALEAKLKAEEEDRVMDDSASEASSSNISGMSVYTRGSTVTAASAAGRSRGRRQGRIRAGSPGEELALVEHLKSMGVSRQMVEELRPLLQALVLLGQGDVSCRLQQAASKLEAAQVEAVRVVEESEPSEVFDKWTYPALERGVV